MPNRLTTSTSRLALFSVGIGILVLALKFWAWALTGSVALWSDALESFVNVATAIAALVAIRYSALPADDNHPFGHAKAEYFSVVLEGVLIIIAALSILSSAWVGLQHPRALDQPALGLAVNVFASAINGVWAWVLVSVGRKRRSMALAADGVHLFTDVATSAGVFVGLVLAVLTGWLVLDPVLAALVAVNILWQGWKLIRVSVGGLMDEAVSPEIFERIRAVISENATGAIEAHDVRTRRGGRMTFIEFHLVVPGAMPVSESHAICDRIEKALRGAVPDIHIAIHVEPEEKAKHSGVVVL
jgi:cation diffusion facilitator family transporter